MVLIKHATAIALAVTIGVVNASAQPSTPPALSTVGSARPLLYGFALECVNCAPGERGRVGGGAAAPPVVWSYRDFPRVAGVAPGSAAEQAGIQPGDILRSIDGLSLLTEQGAARFARASAGEAVRLTFERNAQPVNITLTLGAGAAGRGSGPAKMINGYLALQGHVEGDVSIEIWSDEPIFPRDSTDVVILKIGTNTIIKMRFKKDSTTKREE